MPTTTPTPTRTTTSTTAPAGASLAHQRADAFAAMVAGGGGGSLATEVVVHVRADGNALTDGTPLSDHSVAALLPDAFVSLLLHDNQRLPIDASPRRRFPTRRQRRVLDEIDRECNHPGCHATVFLQYDHVQPYARGGPTTVANLQRLCGPHNRARNTPTSAADSWTAQPACVRPHSRRVRSGLPQPFTGAGATGCAGRR